MIVVVCVWFMAPANGDGVAWCLRLMGTGTELYVSVYDGAVCIS